MRTPQINPSTVNFDEGLAFGQGVFETILWNHSPVLFEEHIRRMESSLHYMKIAPFIEAEKNALYALKTSAILKNKAVKILVTSKNIIVTTREHPYSETYIQKGMSLDISHIKRNSTSFLPKLKTIAYYENIYEKNKAQLNGYEDTLFLNENGTISETTVANIFLVQNNRISTPTINDGILPGIVRRWIIDNFNVTEKSLIYEDLHTAEEVFITNSLMGIMPINQIKILKFPNRKIISEILKNWQELLKESY